MESCLQEEGERDLNVLTCKLCDKIFSRKNELKKHEKLHLSAFPGSSFMCRGKGCRERFVSKLCRRIHEQNCDKPGYGKYKKPNNRSDQCCFSSIKCTDVFQTKTFANKHAMICTVNPSFNSNLDKGNVVVCDQLYQEENAVCGQLYQEEENAVCGQLYQEEENVVCDQLYQEEENAVCDQLYQEEENVCDQLYQEEENAVCGQLYQEEENVVCGQLYQEGDYIFTYMGTVNINEEMEHMWGQFIYGYE